MPCSVSKEEEAFYERQGNERIYGESDLTDRITTRVACELAQIIKSLGAESRLSPVAQKWIKVHEKEDEARNEKPND